jgi:hypothetical protein
LGRFSEADKWAPLLDEMTDAFGNEGRTTISASWVSDPGGAAKREW